MGVQKRKKMCNRIRKQDWQNSGFKFNTEQLSVEPKFSFYKEFKFFSYLKMKQTKLFSNKKTKIDGIIQENEFLHSPRCVYVCIKGTERRHVWSLKNVCIERKYFYLTTNLNTVVVSYFGRFVFIFHFFSFFFLGCLVLAGGNQSRACVTGYTSSKFASSSHAFLFCHS
jgi:hypothetical protein